MKYFTRNELVKHMVKNKNKIINKIVKELDEKIMLAAFEGHDEYKVEIGGFAIKALSDHYRKRGFTVLTDMVAGTVLIKLGTIFTEENEGTLQ